MELITNDLLRQKILKSIKDNTTGLYLKLYDTGGGTTVITDGTELPSIANIIVNYEVNIDSILYAVKASLLDYTKPRTEPVEIKSVEIKYNGTRYFIDNVITTVLTDKYNTLVVTVLYQNDTASAIEYDVAALVATGNYANGEGSEDIILTMGMNVRGSIYAFTSRKFNFIIPLYGGVS